MKLPFGLRMAKAALKQTKFPRKPVGCALIKGPKILLGANSLKTSPLAVELGSRKGRIHAEVSVLKNLDNNHGGKLYVYREKKDGSLGLARPCDSCMKIIQSKGIKTIFYSTPNGFAKEKLIYG